MNRPTAPATPAARPTPLPPPLAADPLSDVLGLLRPRGALSARLTARGRWHLGFGAFSGLKCTAVLQGRCWLMPAGGEAPIALQAGDVYLRASGQAYRLATDPDLPVRDGHELSWPARQGGAHLDGLPPLDGVAVPDFEALGGGFSFESQHAALLLEQLPPLVLLRASDDAGEGDAARELRWLLQRLARELRQPGPGAALMVEHLAQMLLIEVLRAQIPPVSQVLSHTVAAAPGWLAALGDRRIGTVLGMMHREPERHWRLDELASAAGMSRSALAQRFRQLTGHTPMDYLLRWRMRLAGEALREPGRSVASVAQAFGYETDGAFSAAFKRVTGSAPRHHARKAPRPGPPRGTGPWPGGEAAPAVDA